MRQRADSPLPSPEARCRSATVTVGCLPMIKHSRTRHNIHPTKKRISVLSGDALCCFDAVLSYQPLTAPAVMPSTKYFCTSAKRMMTGTVVMVPRAMMMPQSIWVELM